MLTCWQGRFSSRGNGAIWKAVPLCVVAGVAGAKLPCL